MNFNSVWAIALALAVPVSGAIGWFVGAAIKLRQLRQSKLENQKLQLEIAALKREAEMADRRIVFATSEERKLYAKIRTNDTEFMFRYKTAERERKSVLRSVQDSWFDFMMYGFLMYLAIHLLLDLISLGRWLWTMF